MKFLPPLLNGSLIKRYKRFLADIRLDDGRVVVAHCVNSGSMRGVCDPNAEVWLAPAHSPKRKLAFTWELVRAGGELTGINTLRANTLAEEAVRLGLIPELGTPCRWKREVQYGTNSRIDLLLSYSDRPDCYVEVKNVTFMRDGEALFPDAVTARGVKHLRELSLVANEGKRAVMLYILQRAANGLKGFNIAADIDPCYAASLREARACGVEVLCRSCGVSTQQIQIAGPVPILCV